MLRHSGGYPHKQINHQLSRKSRSSRSALFIALFGKEKDMKSIKHRLLSLLLTLVTVLSLLPTAAFAASNTGSGLKITTNQAYWSTRLLANGTPYSYRPPLVDGKLVYCMDSGLGYCNCARWRSPHFSSGYIFLPYKSSYRSPRSGAFFLWMGSPWLASARAPASFICWAIERGLSSFFRDNSEMTGAGRSS